MKRLAGLIAVATMLTACGATQIERQESGDQIFGKAKLVMIGANIGVGLYNALCTDTLSQSSICAAHIAGYVNAGQASTSQALLDAEAVFAASNKTDADKLAAAKAAAAAVASFLGTLSKYGIDKLGQTRQA